MFGLAIVAYFLTVIRVIDSPGFIPIVSPMPDADEYFAMMRGIREGIGPFIQIAGEVLPSRYPPGFAAIGTLFLFVLPEHLWVWAPVFANQVIGLLLLVICFLYFSRTGDMLRGGILALLMATLPIFITFSRSSMSENLGALLIFCAFLCMRSAMRGSTLLYLASAALLGASLNVRLALLFFAPLLLGCLFSHRSWHWKQRLALLVSSGFVYIIAASPLFYLNYHVFGSPLENGYSFWVRGLGTFSNAFSIRHLRPNLFELVTHASATWTRYSVANTTGTGTYVTPAFVLLVCASVTYLRLNRWTVVAGLSCLSAFVTALLYFFGEVRMYYPLIALSAVVAAGTVSDVLRQVVLKRRCTIFQMGCLLCAALSVIGYPSASGYPPTYGRIQLFDQIKWPTAVRTSAYSPILNEVSGLIAGSKTLLLTDANPVLVGSLFPSPVICAPVDGVHDYRYSTHWLFDAGSAAKLAHDAWLAGQPVVALDTKRSSSEPFVARLPKVEGASWKKRPPIRGTSFELFQLVRVGGELNPPNAELDGTPS